MKRLGIMLILILFLPTIASANPIVDPEKKIIAELEYGIQKQINDLDIDEWDKFLNGTQKQGEPIIKEANVKELIRNITLGKFNANTEKILPNILGLFSREIISNLGLMTQIIILAIMSGILKNMQNSFEKSSIGGIANFACYIAIITLIVQSFTSILNVAKLAIDQMVMFMRALFPVLLAFLIAMGGIASSNIFQPTIAVLVGLVGNFLKNTMMPLILFSTILTIICHSSEKLQINRLRNLIKNLCVWILGITFTVFIATLTVQGVMAASIDGVTVRTAKYAVNTFIPVVGSLLSQTVDTVVGCSLIVKNAVGITGLIVICLICLYPTIKILSLLAIYKFSSALIEPISEEKVVECLNDIGNILSILFVTVIGIGIMFFLTVALIIGAGNVTVMMR